MTKKVALLTILSIIVITLIFNLIKNKQADFNETKEEVKNSNILTMMLETEAGTGIYEETTASEWPIDGYIFNETLSKCENGGTLSWDDENKKVIMQSNTSDKCYVYFDIANQTFADYIINKVYTEDGVNGLYYHDGVGTYTNADQEAGDNSYRYSGANPSNYVCFGSDAAICPGDNLYRIIGLFDDDSDGVYNVKLIKYDYATSDMLGTDGKDYGGTYSYATDYYMGSMTTSTIAGYRWNYDTSVSTYGSNDWTTSELNQTNLNIKYYDYLGEKWQQMIQETNWKIGSNVYYNIYNVTIKNTYQNEIKSPAENTIYTAKIGLIYVSDYGYAASPENWKTVLYSYNNTTARNNNWMYMGLYEWTISHRSDSNYSVFDVHFLGDVDDGDAYTAHAVRPSFYLKSEVILEGGTGASADPYRISL